MIDPIPLRSPQETGLSVVVPAYNESTAILGTLTSLREALQGIPWPSEIIVVDDGSEDDTGEKARSQGARVIRHPIQGGYGRALLSGFDAATYEHVAIVDADGTYPIEQLPELLQQYRRGFDMIVGARQGTAYHSSLGKRLLRLVFRLLAEFTTGRRIPDINSGFRIMRRTPVINFRASISTGFSFTTTVTLLFLLNGLFVGYWPVPYRVRVGKSKVRLIPDVLRSLQIVLTTISQYNPLKLILLLAAGNLIVSLLLATAARWVVLCPFTVWLILAIAWNTLCLMGVAGVLVLSRRPAADLGRRARP